MTSLTTHDHTVGWKLVETMVIPNSLGSFRLILGEHPRYGRVMLIEGFGGVESLHGGAWRCRHGRAYRVEAPDTLASLWEPIDRPPYCRSFEQCDRLNWNGSAIQRIAANMGY